MGICRWLMGKAIIWWVLRTIDNCDSPEARDEYIQTVLAGMTGSDPEAIPPALEVRPLSLQRSGGSVEDVAKIFGLKLSGWELEPAGESAIAPSIESTLASLESKRKLLDVISKKYLRRRLRAVLDLCIEAMKADLLSSGSSQRFQLRENPCKGRDVLFRHTVHRAIEHADYSIGLPGPKRSKGLSRDYLVIFLAGRLIEDFSPPHLSLLTYMGIVHKNRRDRGEENTVVYGLSTDSYVYQFWKIDNASKLFATSVYYMDIDGCPSAIVALIQDILRSAGEDCK